MNWIGEYIMFALIGWMIYRVAFRVSTRNPRIESPQIRGSTVPSQRGGLSHPAKEADGAVTLSRILRSRFRSNPVPDPSRREYPRLASNQPIEGIVMDPLSRFARPLRDAVMINFSERGMAISARQPVEPGSMLLHVKPQASEVDSADQINAVVLESLDTGNGYRLRCRVIGYQNPSRLFKAA